MSELQKAEIQFGESGEETFQDYRSVSRASVVGLVLGLLSALSLVHWLLAPIALAAVLVSCLALVQIRARSGELLGRKAALAGIVLGIFFATSATTREYLRRDELDRQARKHAERWLGLLRKGDLPDLYKAFELRQEYPQRQPVGTNLALRYGVPAQFQRLDSGMIDSALMEEYMPRKAFNDFVDRPEIKEVRAAGTESELNFVGVVGRNREREKDVVTLEYELRYNSESQTETTRFTIKMFRTFYDELGEAHWHVVELAPIQT